MTNDAKPMKITVYHSWESGNAKNCRYPNVGAGSTPEELKALFCYDHSAFYFSFANTCFLCNQQDNELRYFNELKARYVVFRQSGHPGKSQSLGNGKGNALQS